MADQKEPKKETVRIALPPRPPGAPAAPRPPGSETVRINMPARPPAGPVARPPNAQAPVPPAPSKAVAPPPTFRPPPTPPGAPTAAPPRPAPPPQPAPVASSGVASSAGPKKETARISLAPEPPARPAAAVQMKKTQPLVTMPQPSRQTSHIAVNVAPQEIEEETTFIESLPMSFCWAVLAASVLILTIQIWNYVS
jgi:hypothetical protein